MFKKLVTIILTLCLCALTFVKSTTLIYADDDGVCDFKNKETYDSEACYNLKQKELQEIEEKIEEARKNMKDAQALANEYGASIEQLQANIEELIPQIEELENRIEELEESIVENELKVQELKTRILKRMETAQGTMHFNPYLDFILGSNGFADMLRRSYGVEAITQKEEADRNKLIDILDQLSKEKEECAEAKYELDAKKANLEADKQLAEKMQSYYEEIVAETYDEIQELMDQEAQNQMILDSIVYELDELLSWDRQTGFIHPVKSASISAGMPYYPASFGGGTHIGIDYAATYGTNILAPADGVIISSVNACPNDRGYHLGDRCGYVEGKGMAAGGNQVRMMFSVNGVIYGLIGFHMLYNSVHDEGVVKAGTTIGKVGSSGNSTGAHCHIELFYLGKGEAEDIIDYLNSGYTVGFNLAYNIYTLCSYKDSAPCRLDGRDYFGYDPVYLDW